MISIIDEDAVCCLVNSFFPFKSWMWAYCTSTCLFNFHQICSHWKYLVINPIVVFGAEWRPVMLNSLLYLWTNDIHIFVLTVAPPVWQKHSLWFSEQDQVLTCSRLMWWQFLLVSKCTRNTCGSLQQQEQPMNSPTSHETERSWVCWAFLHLHHSSHKQTNMKILFVRLIISWLGRFGIFWYLAVFLRQ